MSKTSPTLVLPLLIALVAGSCQTARTKYGPEGYEVFRIPTPRGGSLGLDLGAPFKEAITIDETYAMLMPLYFIPFFHQSLAWEQDGKRTEVSHFFCTPHFDETPDSICLINSKTDGSDNIRAEERSESAKRMLIARTLRKNPEADALVGIQFTYDCKTNKFHFPWVVWLFGTYYYSRVDRCTATLRGYPAKLKSGGRT